MGIGHAGAVAEAAKDINRPHLFINNKGAVDNKESSASDGPGNLTVVPVVVVGIGISAPFQPGAWSAPGRLDP